MFRPAQWTNNRSLFRSLVEGPGLLGWICDADGFCIYLSPAWYAYTGGVDAEGLNWLNYIHPDDRVATRRAVHAAVDERAEYRSDFRLQRSDSKYVVARGHGAPHYDEDGRYLGLMGLIATAEALAEQSRAINDQENGPPAPHILTPREREVLQLFAEGYTAETAGLRLGISQFTVSALSNRAIAKLGALNRTHAVIKALQLNELELDQNRA